jgi:hypothetical protein
MTSDLIYRKEVALSEGRCPKRYDKYHIVLGRVAYVIVEISKSESSIAIPGWIATVIISLRLKGGRVGIHGT